jgi:hypothetical protein
MFEEHDDARVNRTTARHGLSLAEVRDAIFIATPQHGELPLGVEDQSALATISGFAMVSAGSAACGT